MGCSNGCVIHVRAARVAINIDGWRVSDMVHGVRCALSRCACQPYSDFNVRSVKGSSKKTLFGWISNVCTKRGVIHNAV
jgi:hypothetical protein